ncbi:MAG: hypothetical protein ACREEO_09980 [Phenylobacterium sp.]
MGTVLRRLARCGRMLSLVAALGACSDPANPSRADAELTPSGATQIDPKLLAEVDGRVKQAIDIVPQAMIERLANASVGGRAYGPDLVLRVDDASSVELDGWYAARGLTELAGTDYGGALWGLTGRGSQFVAQSGEGWLIAKRGAEPKVVCRSGASITQSVCEVAIPYAVSATPAGEQMLGKVVPFAFSLTALATATPGGWDLTDLRADGETPPILVLNALLGPADGREEARRGQLQAALETYRTPPATPGANSASPAAQRPTSERWTASTEAEPDDGVAEYQPD